MPAQRLTRQTIAALTVPPGKQDAFLWDSDVSGLGVKASAGGSRRYVLQYRPNGERTIRRLTIGNVETLPLDEARRQARTLLAQATVGNDPHAAKKATKAQAALTVGMVVERYIAHCRTRQRASTLYQTNLHLSTHWAPLHRMAFERVRRADVAARLTELARSSGGVSANRSRAQLSAMFSWAIGNGLTETNPVAGTLKLAEERARERVLTEGELRLIWNACRDDAYGRIVRILMLTGQRRDEVGGITEDEIDLDTGIWTLPAARSKNHREHVVPLSAPVVEILRTAPRLVGRPTLFGLGEGGFSGWSRCKSALDARLVKAGTPIAAWTIHDLRRTAATMMADRLGVQPHHVEAVLNHVGGHKAGIAGVYNRATYATEKREALNRWAAFLNEIV